MQKNNQPSIAFLCGCLEPGKDGVGDYVRRLGAELVAQGYRITFVALNDRLTSAILTDDQVLEDLAISCLRLPASLKKEKKLVTAKKWISDFDPEWLSLQYVPYSFQEKGIPIGFSKQLATLGTGRKWHIMFHEIYVGMEKQAPLKYRLVGNVQSNIIGRMIKKLQPKVIHTHSVIYSEYLSKLTKELIHRLPLFSNIPMNANQVVSQNQQKLIFVLFGWIHQNSPVDNFIQEILKYSKTHKKEVVLQLIGKSDGEKQGWIKAFETAKLEVQDLGEQSPQYISKILSEATFGLTTTPYALVEKSGTVSAMLEHDLPVICIAKPWTPLGIDNYEIAIPIQEYQPGSLEAIINKEYILEIQPTVQSTAKKMATDLSAYFEN